MEETSVRLPYSLLPWQKRAKAEHRGHRFYVICAGRRSGKTLFDTDDLIQGAVTVPGSVNWYVGPTYGAAKDIAWSVIKRNIEPFRELGLIQKMVESDLLIRWWNDSVIQLKGGDKPDSLRGVKLNRVVVDEISIMRPEVWEEVLAPATSDLQAPVLFTFTPKGYNHAYDLYQMELKNSADWKSLHVKTSEAGTIPAEEIERARRDMDPRVFRQEYEASFETFGGQVYTDFDRTVHVVDGLGFVQGTRYVCGMDFGWASPSYVCFANVDAQDNVTVFAEYIRRETAVPVIGKAIKETVPGQVPGLIVCDPAGAAKSEAMGFDCVTELRNIFGYDTVRYRANYPGVIQDGVNVVRKWLRNGKLKISKNCPHLIQAFEMYRYPDPKNNVQSEEPLKDGISDHPMDGLRYLMSFLFLNRSRVEAL